MTKKDLASARLKGRKCVQEHIIRMKKISCEIIANDESKMTNLMTPQTLGKAKQCANRHLPKSPRKKTFQSLQHCVHHKSYYNMISHTLLV